MNVWVISALILPIWGAFYALYFILRKHRLYKESLIAKCGGTLVAVSSVALALTSGKAGEGGGENPLTSLLFWFFLLCAVADVLLELQFLVGMLVFGAGHVCGALWLYQQVAPTRWSFVLWVVALGICFALFHKELPKLQSKAVPFCLYGAVLSALLALALPAPFTDGPACWPIGIGALLFFISDMMVAKGYFSKWGERFQKGIMLLYWGALFFLSTGLWLLGGH